MKRLLVLSGKGGTGKTTVSSSFIEFAQARAIADCDVDAPNLHLITKMEVQPEVSDFLGVEKAEIDPEKCVGCGQCAEHCRFGAVKSCGEVYQILDYACEGCGICEYVCPRSAVTMKEDVAGRQELYKGETVFSTAALKMGRGNSGKLVTAVKLAMLKAAPETDLAVIDGSPGIGCPVIASMSGMDLVLIVAEPSVSGKNDLERLIKTAESFQMKMGVCVNKWDTSPEKTKEIEEWCDEQGNPFMGRIPYDKEVSKAVNAGKSVAAVDCPARTALLQIYKNVRNELKI